MQCSYSQNPSQDAGRAVGVILKQHLEAGERVTWLLSGGSGKAVAHATLAYLNGVNLSKLSVSLTDERYGTLGHPDENWQQLLDEGFGLPGATLYRPLKNVDATTTASDFSDWLGQQCATGDFCLAIFGIGADGHTAGIKPHSPALTAQSLATCYRADDFQRLTITPAAFSCIDAAVIQASGIEKKATLHRLLHDDVLPADQPAQLLKTIPRTELYTNIPEEELL